MDRSPMEDIKKLYRKAMKDKGLPQEVRTTLEALWASHSTKGQDYRSRGMRREAIDEFRKDTERGIRSYEDAIVAENAFCLMGDTFMELGEIENAINAYEGAMKLWRQYGYGSAPHVSLAEAYLKQGRTDDAISICEEIPENSRGSVVRQVLNEARRRKAENE